MLSDNFGRFHTYLRISLTDACNMRCNYCMPLSNYKGNQGINLMSSDEIYSLANTFVLLGVTKIRLTGGESLLRNDFADILRKLTSLPVTLAISTNGLLLDKYFDVIRECKVKQVNVSLDTLDPDTFKEITRSGRLAKIISNINTLLSFDLQVKINLVLLKNVNEHDVIDLIAWTKDKALDIRFIEFMPFKRNGWDKRKVLDYKTVLTNIHQHFDIVKLEDEPHSTSRNYQVKGYKGSFGFITTVSEPFCDTCNRLRLTSDGKMRNCLFAKSETDLLNPLRQGQDIVPLILQNIKAKAKALGGMTELNNQGNRSMIQIGG